MMKKILPVFLVIILASGAHAILDPSRVYCESLGYEFTIQATEWGETGFCTLPNGTLVDSWEFLKGKTAREYSYCTQSGYDIKTVSNGSKCSSIFSNECAVCIVDGEEIEVTALMNLSFKESVCGDGICTVEEDYLTCPEDCPSGIADGYCDALNDTRCDPDCTEGEDPDCPFVGEPGPEVECIDGDGLCLCDCVGQDSDCLSENGTIISCVNTTPESGVYPEPGIECVYDGVCYPECMGTDDLDCLCIDPDSTECLQAKAELGADVPEAPEGIGFETVAAVLVAALVIIILGYTAYRKKSARK